MVSVIVPAYNAEKNIDKCVASILSQDCQDIECIIVDDGSTDHCPDICDEWAKKDNRIRVVHQKNQGVSCARNKGIEIASGEFLCFVDSDDWLGPQYVSHLVSAIGSCELAVSGIHQYSLRGSQYDLAPKRNEVFSLDKSGENSFCELNQANLLYPPFVKLFRTDIVKQYDIRFPEGCSFGEDLQFVYAYLRHVDRIATIKDVDYHYLMAEGGSLSTTARPNAFEQDYKQWRVLKDFHDSKGLRNENTLRELYNRLIGIVYNSLFSSIISGEQIKKTLSIPEIKDLSPYLDEYPCANWIKFIIRNRCNKLFSLYRLLK